MKFSLTKNDQFFELLKEQTKICQNSAILINKICQNISNINFDAKEIKENEHKCDSITKKIAEELNLTFITPIDREDIYNLAALIDDIMDYIDELALNFSIYNITTVNEEAILLSQNLIKITESTYNLVSSISNFKNKSIIEEYAREISRYENTADEIYFNSVANLFKKENDPIEVIKWEKIYTTFENVANQCKEVTNTINKLLIKHT